MRKKVQLGRVEVSDEYAKWIKYVNKEGEVWAMQPGRFPKEPHGEPELPPL